MSIDQIRGNSVVTVSLVQNVQPGDVEQIAEALCKNSALTSLDLSRNSLCNQDVEKICPAIASSRLKQLKISYNKIGNTGINLLCKTFLSHSTMLELKVDGQEGKKIEKSTLLLIQYHSAIRSNRCALSRLKEDDELYQRVYDIPQHYAAYPKKAVGTAYYLLAQISHHYRRLNENSLSATLPITVFLRLIKALLQEDTLHYGEDNKLPLLQAALAYLYLSIAGMQESYESISFLKEALQGLREQLAVFEKLSSNQPVDPTLPLIFQQIQGLINVLRTDENLLFSLLSSLPSAAKLEFSVVKNSITTFYSQMGKPSVIDCLLIWQLSYLVMQGDGSQLDEMKDLVQREKPKKVVLFVYLDALGEIIKRVDNQDIRQKAYDRLQSTLHRWGITQKSEYTPQTTQKDILFKAAQLLCELRWIKDDALGLEKWIENLSQNKNLESDFINNLNTFRRDERRRDWRDWATRYPLSEENSTDQKIEYLTELLRQRIPVQPTAQELYEKFAPQFERLAAHNQKTNRELRELKEFFKK